MSIISVEDAKAHMNIVGDDDNTLIGNKIGAAEAFIDRWLAEPMADMDEVPADLKQAVLMLTAHFYENREATLVGISADEVPFGAWDIINQHREWAF